MRNPIQPTPLRPFPLPDRILRDAWWVVEARSDQPAPDLRVIAGAMDEGHDDRSDCQGWRTTHLREARR